MKQTEPTITRYIFVRMSFMMLVLLSAYYLILTELLHREPGSLLVDMVLMAVILMLVVLVTTLKGKLIQSKLIRVNRYLETLENPKKLAEEDNLVTKEFSDIWGNLRKVLTKARKREEDKHKYAAKLKLKNKQRSDMLSAIAHEFRNPISSIIGYAQTLYEDPHIPRPLQEKFLGKVYRNGHKIEELLSRLILWNKFESGEAKCHLSRFDLRQLARETAQSLEEKYPSRTLTIEGESSLVYADRTLIDIVLKNLIENALKYSSAEVRIVIDTGQVSVVDHGIGISRKDIDKVTKKFYRSGTHSWDNSMGLGLSIVKNILTLHHTKLQIESREDEGSTFSFVLRHSD